MGYMKSMYNVVEKLRAGEPLTPRERRSTRSPRAACSGTCTTSWTGSSPTRTAGRGPWRPRRSSPVSSSSTTSGSRRSDAALSAGLRPDYRVPRFDGRVEAGDPATATPDAEVAAPDDLPAWPDDAIEQLTALRAAIADRPGTVEAVARRFRGAGRADVEKHLETLKVLAVVAGDGEGKWVVQRMDTSIRAR
jgi:hypothetical protein